MQAIKTQPKTMTKDNYMESFSMWNLLQVIISDTKE